MSNKFVEADFTGQRITIDHSEFHRCNFSNATLVYFGQGPVVLEGCNMTGCKWAFEGPAGNTLQFLIAMSRDPFFKGFVKKTFEGLF